MVLIPNEYSSTYNTYPVDLPWYLVLPIRIIPIFYQVSCTCKIRIVRVLRRGTYLFAPRPSSRCPAPPLCCPPTPAFGPIAGGGLDGRCLGSLARLAPPGGGAPLGGGTRPLRAICGGGGPEGGGGGPRLGGLSMQYAVEYLVRHGQRSHASAS